MELAGKPKKLSIFWLFEATLFPRNSVFGRSSDESMVLTCFLNPFSSSLPSFGPFLRRPDTRILGRRLGSNFALQSNPDRHIASQARQTQSQSEHRDHRDLRMGQEGVGVLIPLAAAAIL